MPLYSYTAKNTKGQTTQGKFDSDSKLEVARELRRRGFVPIKIEQKRTPKRISKKGTEGHSTVPSNGLAPSGVEGLLKQILSFDVGRMRGVPLSDKMMFSRQLAVMISAGVPITRALEVLSQQTKNIRFQNAILNIAEDIRRGKRISEALAQYPDIFNNLYVSLVRSGDSAGNITEVLELLADQLKKEHELKSRVRGAFMYPAVIVVAMTGIGILMMTMVVPKLSQIFEDLNTDLPMLTRVIIGVSEFVSAYWFFILGSLPVLIYIVKKLVSRDRGRVFFSWLFLKLPVLGGLTRKINSARFARTLSSLIKGGVPILEGINITTDTLSNEYYKKSMIEIHKDVKRGKTLFESIAKFENIYPGLIVQMVRVGEETGSLSEILYRIAGFYEEEVSNITKNLSSIIEPILMLIIGAAVGIFAISMIQPMYSIMGSI